MQSELSAYAIREEGWKRGRCSPHTAQRIRRAQWASLDGSDANIHAKRKRIAAGSGEKMRKVGRARRAHREGV